MGLPLFVAPPSPPRKNATTNSEKEVAQYRSAIRRQRTVRGTPNWSLRDSRWANVDRAIEHVDNANDASVRVRAVRRLQENTSRLAVLHRGSRLHPPTSSAPGTYSDSGQITDTEMQEHLSELDNERMNDSNTSSHGPSFMEQYSRAPSEHGRVLTYDEYVANIDHGGLEVPPTRGHTHDHSESRSVSSPLSTSYAIGFTPTAHVATSNMRSLQNLGISSQPPPPRHWSSSGLFRPSRGSRQTRMADLLAQRGRRIRVRGSNFADGLGDRDRSVSPDNPADWDTLTATLAPDPQAPSTANSSFTSASTNPSTAAASTTSLTSESNSSATSATDTSTRSVRHNPFGGSRQRALSTLGSTRSIPDFSIPRDEPAQGQNTERPLIDLIDLCESGDELESPETDENLNMAAQESDGDEDTNADEAAAAVAVVDRARRTYAEVLNEDTARELRYANESSGTLARRPAARETWPLLSEFPPLEFEGVMSSAAPPAYQDSGSRSSGNGEGDEGDDERILGGMRRIIRAMTERDDIPDEWWASVGLSRIVGTSGGAGERERERAPE